MTMKRFAMHTRQLNNGCYRIDWDWSGNNAIYLNGKEVIGVLMRGLTIQLVTTCAVFNARMNAGWMELDDDKINFGDVWWYIAEITR